MPWLEDAKRIVERATGWQRPKRDQLRIRPRKANGFRFADDGDTPNHPSFPLLLYRSPVVLDPRFDPAAIFEVLFARNGWRAAWRDGIYDYLHFHTTTHEVLGIARGEAQVRFGGEAGRLIRLRAGDVVVLPAGTGHCCESASDDLLVVGAYPKGGEYNERRPDRADPRHARRSILEVPVPSRDPVYGAKGPLRALWPAKAVARSEI